MFVEIVRLIVVVLCTAAGFELAPSSADGPQSIAVLGATLGALVGYVVGGALGRLVRRATGALEEQVERAPAAQLLVGGVGAVAAGILCGLLSVPAVLLVPQPWGWSIFAVLVWIGAYEGFQVTAHKTEELLALAGLSTRPLVTAAPYAGERVANGVLLDTSAVIDGRLLAVAEAGFLSGPMLVARFVLDELQGIADAQDPFRRRRGRRGLEMLEALRRERFNLHIVDDEVPEFDEVDAKLIALARRLKASLVTTDHNLQRVAELQGVTCLNVNRLADVLRPAVVPGEIIRLPITRQGREPGQGVGFLDDGTMVVVGDAAPLVGSDAAVRITSNVQTSVGRMLFATLESV
jgi:uncharacterized protein YacL